MRKLDTKSIKIDTESIEKAMNTLRKRVSGNNTKKSISDITVYEPCTYKSTDGIIHHGWIDKSKNEIFLPKDPELIETKEKE